MQPSAGMTPLPLPRLSKAVHIVFSVLIAFVEASCVPEPLSPPPRLHQADLSAAVARWRAADIKDYTFEIELVCFCPPIGPYRVTVEEGEVVSLVWADSGTAVDTSVGRAFYTVDSIFGFIQQELDQRPDTVRAEYDQQLGFPILFYRDYRPVDSYLWFTISKFTSGPGS